MKITLEATAIALLIVLGILLALGLMNEPLVATGQTGPITPVVGTAVCAGYGCSTPRAWLPSIMR